MLALIQRGKVAFEAANPRFHPRLKQSSQRLSTEIAPSRKIDEFSPTRMTEPQNKLSSATRMTEPQNKLSSATRITEPQNKLSSATRITETQNKLTSSPVRLAQQLP